MSYLIHIATGSDADHSFTPPQNLDLALKHEALAVYTDDAIVPGDQACCAIGRLFTKSRPYRRVEKLDARGVAPSSPQQACEKFSHFWGGFVGVIACRDQSAIVLRDPSGMMPCYIRKLPGAVLISDDIRLLGPSDGINDEAIGRLLFGLDAIGRATCLQGVEELGPGECLVVGRSGTEVSAWWTPWDFVSNHNNEPIQTQAQRLRETVLECTQMWSECFDHKLIGVSGGLDSSIVAACIGAQAGLRCVTFMGPDAEGDERDYAASLTNALGLKLESRLLELSAIDIERPCLPHLPSPIASYATQAAEGIHRECHAAGHLGAIFSGNGGDNIFLNIRSAIPLVDRMMADGLGRGAFETLDDLLKVTGSSARAVLRATIPRFRKRRAGHVPGVRAEGLHPDMANRIERQVMLQPWLEHPAKSLPGKATHIALLLRGQRSLELYPGSGAPKHIAPLLSQPIVELCLGIPSWRWISGGRDRSIARQAFTEILPASLINRRSKGGPGGFMHAVYMHNRTRLHAMLRDGILVQRGLIDPRYIEEPVDLTQRGRGKVQRLLAFGAAEAWARFWLAQASPTASRSSFDWRAW